MKWFLLAAALFFEACHLPRGASKDAVTKFPETYQALRAVDAKGPIGEDSVVTVTFRRNSPVMEDFQLKSSITGFAMPLTMGG